MNLSKLEQSKTKRHTGTKMTNCSNIKENLAERHKTNKITIWQNNAKLSKMQQNLAKYRKNTEHKAK